MESLEQRIKSYALDLGFSHVGICAVQEGDTVPRLRDWLSRNYHGQMKYMENEKRLAPAAVLEGTRSMIVVAMNYRWPDDGEMEQEAIISKYAWSQDYHEVMKPLLEMLAAFVREMAPEGSTRAYVDTGPIVEKHWAQKAGIGWIGKHTNIISTHGSSWLFLGEVLTDLSLKADPAAQDHCGSCSRCIEVCPTRAIVAPYVLDARLCISYLTIELRASIPRELRSMIGNRIFGCDDCQDVCPWNRFAFAGDPHFTPQPEVLSATLREYLRMTASEFKKRFAGTNVLRTKHRGFIRNCLIAAGNAVRPDLRPDIVRHLASDDPMIREHAVWALACYNDSEARLVLRALRERETDATVLSEIDYCLSS